MTEEQVVDAHRSLHYVKLKRGFVSLPVFGRQLNASEILYPHLLGMHVPTTVPRKIIVDTHGN